MNFRHTISTGLLMLCSVSAFATDANGGYLFAHMIPTNYGRLYYSVSRDGLTWKTLNGGNIVLPDYKGHPDIVRGGDGQWHMVGVVFGGDVKVLPL